MLKIDLIINIGKIKGINYAKTIVKISYAQRRAIKQWLQKSIFLCGPLNENCSKAVVIFWLFYI